MQLSPDQDASTELLEALEPDEARWLLAKLRCIVAKVKQPNFDPSALETLRDLARLAGDEPPENETTDALLDEPIESLDRRFGGPNAFRHMVQRHGDSVSSVEFERNIAAEFAEADAALAIAKR